MSLLVGFAILVVLALPLALAILRSNELFSLEVTRGKVRVNRGRLPKRLLSDLEDVLRRPPVRAASIRVIAEGGKPRVEVTAGKLSEGRVQQLRNVIGRFEVTEIRAGARARARRR